MDVLRTPDERFNDLPGYPFEPHYVHVSVADSGQLRVHYIDEGPHDGQIVMLLHGEPSWSYLYRRMVPVLVAAGLRAVAIDLVGFGVQNFVNGGGPCGGPCGAVCEKYGLCPGGGGGVGCTPLRP